jgi:PAS domain S-box-containing protein
MASPDPRPAADHSASSLDHGPLLDRALVAGFLSNIPDNVYFKDRDSRFIAVSGSFLRYFGLQRQADIVGKTDFDFFSQNHAAPAFEDEQRILRTGESIIGKLEKEVWPDGRVTWVMTSKMPLRGDQGEIIGTFGISKDVTASKQMEEALEKANKDLMDASRMAGMAEVATGVLHNVGNVLNSINVSATVIATGLRQTKTGTLAKVCDLLDEHADDLGAFLTQDPKGKLVPDFIKSLSRHSTEERARLLQETDSLQRNIDHIKEIVSMQQTYATMVGVLEPLSPDTLMEDSLRMNSSALARHDVSVVRDFRPVPAVLAERGKVLQILINLIRNAKYALDEGGGNPKVLTLRIEPGPAENVRFVIEDNGVGIPPENLPRIFGHGFTTRAHGHGFGLHSSALAAKELHGSLAVQSEGAGKGARFTLELPAALAAGGVGSFPVAAVA